jgi:hypothetical protein
LQCFSFLATKDHFSSNWTSRVLGGKSHEVVVEVLGVLTGLQGQADDRVLVDAGEAAGLADANTFLEMSQDGDGFVIGEAAVEQGGAVAFAEAVLAGAAGQVAALLGGAIAEGDTEVALATLTIVGALRVLAAEVLEVVHGRPYRNQGQVVASTLPLL